MRKGVNSIRSVRVSGTFGNEITWFEVETVDSFQWIGIEGALEGTDLATRSLIGISTGLAAIVLVALWFSRAIVRPINQLGVAMRSFEISGEVPNFPTSKVPNELKTLWQQYIDLSQQRNEFDVRRKFMLAAISHDLRSPLTRIRVAAELISNQQSVLKNREHIIRNVAIANRLLENFIDMAHADDFALKDWVDISSLIKNISHSSDGVVLVRFPRDSIVVPEANGILIERAILNLINNSALHGRGPIEIGLRSESNFAIVWVRDYGPGIPDALCDEMLKPFTRGEDSRITPGSGLGLAVVKRVVERHGGKISIRNLAPGLMVELHFRVDLKGHSD
jgi:two-component system osmolarity sensor histidine kinase EnvZ